MRVCYFGTYRAEYNRNKIMISALESAGVDVAICHENLWYSIEDRENVTAGGWRSPKFWLRVFVAYTRLLWNYTKIGDYDVMVVGYPGQIDIFLARFLSNLQSKPLVLDVLISLYLVSKERGLEHRKYSATKFLKYLEQKSLIKPDLLLLDTQAFAGWFEKNLKISGDRFKVVPIGADDKIFFPRPEVVKDPQNFVVLYYGTFIPNHGIKTIMEAAAKLEKFPDIRIVMIGDGPERKWAEAYVASNNLLRVSFIDWIPQQELAVEISKADVSLGAFGDRPQSLLTVHNKIYECMALGKTVLVAKTPATEAQFSDEIEVKMCESTGESIAGAILYLKENPDVMEKISINARKAFIENYSINAIGKTFRSHLEHLLQCK
jgi:glycosyltransferase involved in cell wall biosynthesis